MSNYITFFALILSTIIWGSSFIVLKLALETYNPYTIIFFRMLFASVIFLFFIKKILNYNFTRGDIKNIFLLSLFEPCLYFLFEAKALVYTSAAQAGAISSLMPITTAIAAIFFLNEKISKQLILGCILGFTGLLVLSFNSEITQNASNPLLGNLLEFLAMTCSAGYAIIAKKMTEKFSALFITASQVLLGTLFFLPFFIYDLNNYSFNFNLNAFLYILYLSLFVSICGYGLFNFALSKTSASKAGMFINLVPVFTLLIAYIVLNEKLNVTQLFACGLILFAVFISQAKLLIPNKIYNIYKRGFKK